MERRIKSLVRWNALAMVVRANKIQEGIGGHISTFASAATLYGVAFNHFLAARTENGDRDIVYYQGHASPGIYARAYLEGRIPKQKLENFRRELKPGGGLSSYPHPWLMPDFWEFPTVSMGLGPISAIYQARFNRYLQARGIKNTDNSHVWAFVGDGECDEPESLGSLFLASREKLDNLIFVINCNLQRLDGPVRGNGKIIQELEMVFRGAGWNVIKVIWGRMWDDLLRRDVDGVLRKKMEDTVDGAYQKFSTSDGPYRREHFFGPDPRLRKLVEHLSQGTTAVFVGMAHSLNVRHPATVNWWWLVVAAGVSMAWQCAFLDEKRQEWQRRVYHRLRDPQERIDALRRQADQWRAEGKHLAARLLIAGYRAYGMLWAPVTRARSKAPSPEMETSARWADCHRPVLRRSVWVGPTMHVTAIAVFAGFLDRPDWYLWAAASVGNLWMLATLAAERRASRCVAEGQ